MEDFQRGHIHNTVSKNPPKSPIHSMILGSIQKPPPPPAKKGTSVLLIYSRYRDNAWMIAARNQTITIVHNITTKVVLGVLGAKPAFHILNSKI